MKNPAGHNRGFTLLEVLIAIFLFSILTTALFLSYRTLFVDTDDFENGIAHYEMAQACLARITTDLRSIHINLPPLYTKPGMDAPPGDYRVVGETDFTGASAFGRLRFTSTAHLAAARGDHSGIAEIRYYVHTGDEDRFVLRRSDTLYPYPPFEESRRDPVLCENVKALQFTFFDDAADEHETWNSESADFKYATPVAIGVELEVGDEHTSRYFTTRIALPVYRQPLE